MNEILDLVIDMIEQKFNCHIKKGAMPKGNAISIYLSANAPSELYFNKSSYNTIFATLNGKNKSQLAAINILEEIHRYLTSFKAYPCGEDFQITNIGTSSAVNFIRQEEDGEYLYGSILQINYYLWR